MNETFSAEELLENTGWMKTLARRLVVGESDADDVVQSTWLAFFTKPPPDRQGTRSWLAAVLRNLAKRSQRTEYRLQKREHQAARPELLSVTPDKVLERAEIQHQVVDVVLQLDEPYRSTILLRFFEELSLTEIACRQDVPVSTVTSRIQGGLKKVRARLDRLHRGNREEWCAALVPLVFVSRTNTHPPIPGELSMKSLTALVVAALAAGIGIGRLSLSSSTPTQAIEVADEFNSITSVSDFILEDVRGNRVPFSERIKGKVALLTFWGASCAPCQLEAPHLSKLYEDFQEEGFVVLAVNAYGDSEKTVEQFVQEHRLRYPVLLSGSGVAEAFSVDVFPTAFLIDRSGRIVERFVGYTPGKEEMTRARVRSLIGREE